MKFWPSDNAAKDKLVSKFPSSEFDNIKTYFRDLLVKISEFYLNKIRKFCNSNNHDHVSTSQAIDIQEHIFSTSASILEDTLSKQERNLDERLKYHWDKVSNKYSAPASRVAREIPFSKIVNDIYPVLREIVFFNELKSKIHLSLIRQGLIFVDLKFVEYPVIVFPNIVGTQNEKSSSGEMHTILKHYDEVERRFVESAMEQLRYIVKVTEIIVEVSEQNTIYDKGITDPDSKSTTLVSEGSPPTANTLTPTKEATYDEKNTKLPDTAAKKEMSKLKDATAENKEGQAFTRKIPIDDDDKDNNELADAIIEDGLKQAGLNMLINVSEVKNPKNIEGTEQEATEEGKEKKHVSIAFKYDVTKVGDQIEDKRNTILDSMKKYVDLLPIEETITDIQEEYDAYILEVNEIFMTEIDILSAFLEHNPIIKGKKS